MARKVWLVDKNGNRIGADVLIPLDNNESVVTIDFQHHQIHTQTAFTTCKVFTHGAGASPNVLIVTPNTDKSLHFFHQVISDGVLQVDLYEAPDYSGGAALTLFNRNRNSPSTSTATFTSDATDDGAGKGTLIWTFKAGANKTVTSSEGQRFEFILKRNSKYLLEAIGASGDLITVLLDFYEHIEHD